MAIKGTVILLTLILLSVGVSAQNCKPITSEGACNSQGGCVGRYRREEWTYGDWIFDRCVKCKPKGEITCKDYVTQSQCGNDPCGAVQGEADAYDCRWHSKGYCYNNYCISRISESDCILYNCYPKYKEGGAFDKCIECPRDTKCSDYDAAKPCGRDSCKVPGLCAWSGKSCEPDVDGDGIAELIDNCPNVKNPGQENNYCTRNCVSWSSDPECCKSDPGDACDDVDGDGLLDSIEDKNGNRIKDADETDPLDSDSDDNCISDGVEHGFDPVIEILAKIAVGLAIAMLAYQGLRWVTSDSPEDRDSAKQGVVYIILGMLLLIGGKDVATFIFYMNCSGETPQVGHRCDCTPPPGGGGGSCPYIYSFDGKDYYLEHDAFPVAAFKSWEYESYSVLENLKPNNNSYRIRITEELPETSYINKLSLWVVDAENNIYPDRHGNLYVIENPVMPASCVEKSGKYCMELMYKDEKYWLSSLDGKNLSDLDDDGVIDFKNKEDMYDFVILTFPNQEGKKVGKLLMNVRDSDFQDFEYEYAFRDIVGKNFELLEEIEDIYPMNLILDLVRTLEASLDIRVWDGGKWILQDSFVVGQDIGNEIVIPLNLPETSEVKVMLSSAILAHEIDYVVMDYSEKEILSKKELPPERMVGNDESVEELSFDDDSYYVVDEGDSVELLFPIVNETNASRTYIIAVKGYYRPYIYGGGYDLKSFIELAVRVVLDPTYVHRFMLTEYISEGNV